MEPSPPPRRGPARAWIWPLAILALALALRAAYVAEIRTLPDFDRALVDAGYHEFWAWGMVSGEWVPPQGAVDPDIPGTPYFRPPLTTYWLASIYALAGRDPLAVRGAQILLGSWTCLLAAALARRLFGGPSGIVTGFLAATYWVLVYFDTEYREVSLLAFLYPAFVLALLRWRSTPRASWALAAGAALGLSVLGKPNGVLLVPIAAAWMLLATRGRPARRRAPAHAGILAGTAVLCVLPVTLRNVVRSGEWVVVSSNGGINLYIGNNPVSTGVSVALPEEVPTFDSAFDYPELVAWAEGRAGRGLTHAQASRWFTGRALEHALGNPGPTLALYMRKALAFWSATEIVSEKDLVQARRESNVLRFLPLGFAGVFAAGAIGLVLALGGLRGHGPRPDAAALALVAACVATYALSYLPFFVTGRYRAPLLPLLLPFAAHAAVGAVAVARAGRWRALLRGGIACGALYALAHLPVPDYERDPANTLAQRGAQLAAEGRLEEAEPLLRRAVDANPDHAQARNNLGLLLLQSGRFAEAVGELRRAVALDGADFRAHQNLGLALIRAGRAPDAPGPLAEARRLQPRDGNLPLQAAQAYLDVGMGRRAREQLEQAVALAPDSVVARERLGVLCLQLGSHADGVRHLEHAAGLAPQNPGLLSNLGLAHAENGDFEAALRWFQAAQRLAPNDPTIRRNVEEARRRLEEQDG